MTTTERIVHHLQSLSETRRLEVLDFVEFIKSRSREENAVWAELSLASAMRGMEEEESLYTLEDIKEPP